MGGQADMMLLRVAFASLRNRRSTVLLTLLSLAVSVALILGIDHLRREAKSSFSQTISGIDLIVGARSGSVNLLLYSVFRIGNATNNISWESYQHFAGQKQVKWTIPLSLGDSHRGYRVMGTDHNYFQHFRYGNRHALSFSDGKPFSEVYDTVLGAEVARKLGYQTGDRIIIAHGLGDAGFSEHKDKPFTVSGILQATGTPVDQTVHVSLQGIEAVHQGWSNTDELIPVSITAFMVGLQSRIAAFSLQRAINDYPAEPLLAILPGATLADLWHMMGMVESLLFIIASLVLVATLVGMMSLLLASMKERQRELSLLRAMGARVYTLVSLIMLETLLLASAGCLLGVGLLSGALTLFQPVISEHFGLFIRTNPVNEFTFPVVAGIVAMACLLSLLPAILAYRGSLVQQLGSKH
jgi:putative ABC transport system permease protein